MKKKKLILTFISLFFCAVLFCSLTSCNNDGESNFAFKTLNVNDKTAYGKVSSDTQYFSFVDEIDTGKKADFIVSYDIEGTQQVLSKTIELAPGDNTVYVIEMLNNEPKNTYAVTIRRKLNYMVTFNTNGGTSVNNLTVEEDTIISEPSTSRKGYIFDCWNYDFNNPITGDTHITATWQANTDIKYKVEYYLENVTKDGYELVETVNLTGMAGSFVTAEQKPFEHFTYDAQKSVTNGSIEGDGSLVLQVYHTRDIYTVKTSVSDSNGGTVTVGGAYPYGAEINLSTIVNPGYTFVGYFSGKDNVCATTDYKFTASEDVSVVAKIKANNDTAYRVEYYLENLDNKFSLIDTVTLYGTTNTFVVAEKKNIEHFKVLPEQPSVLNGNIAGDGSLVLKVYYCRNVYSIINTDPTMGSVTSCGSYTYGSIEPFEITASVIGLGYEFVGWFNDDSLVSNDSSYTFTCKMTVEARFAVKKEMSNFVFDSTTETCSIVGIKDCTVTEIVIPNYVTEISRGAFSTCTSVERIAIPFVGAKASGTTDNFFGYIFGQSYASLNCVPSSLKTVLITGGSTIDSYAFAGSTSIENIIVSDCIEKIGSCAFNSCSSLKNVQLPNSITTIFSETFRECTNLESVIIPDSVTSIGDYAFYNCNNLANVTIGAHVRSVGDWSFYNCSKLLSFSMPDSVKSIGEYAFYGCKNLTNASIGNNVTSIGNSAFQGCLSLKKITIPNTVTTINTDVFNGCSSLSNVTIGNGVQIISSQAFLGCSSLANVTIPNSVKTLGDDVFSGCYNLISIIIPESTSSIGSYAFRTCSKLAVINYCGTQSQWNAIAKGSNWNYKTGSYEIHFNCDSKFT